jgi:hypothetical protein
MPCQRPTPPMQLHRRRCADVLAVLIAVGMFALPLLGANEVKPEDRFRGGKVEWARLQHRGLYWNRHAESDDALLSFIRSNTTLNIDSVWHAASASDLAAMTEYPFLFADTLDYLNPAEQHNLAEYLRRVQAHPVHARPDARDITGTDILEETDRRQTREFRFVPARSSPTSCSPTRSTARRPRRRPRCSRPCRSTRSPPPA